MNHEERIISQLSHGDYTNQELSRDLDIPEASVRRSTLRLENSGKIYNVSDSTPLIWKSRSPLSMGENQNDNIPEYANAN